MKLKLTAGDNLRAILMVEGDAGTRIAIRGLGAVGLAQEVERAVNRDFLFDALVSALRPFRSDEMGQLLIDTITADVLGGATASEAAGRMRKLVHAIDRITDAADKFSTPPDQENGK